MPVKAIFCGPPKLGGVDRSAGCFCEDNCAYVIKTDKPDATCPHNEWFCNQLGGLVSVPVTDVAVVEHTDGNLWFGSKWVEGEVKNWWIEVQNKQINASDVEPDISRIYAFDLFVSNGDRHLNNFMVTKNGSGHRIYSIDFGRSWLAFGFPPPLLPFAPTVNTVTAGRYLRSIIGIGFDLQAALDVLSKIRNVPDTSIQQIISAHPTNWLTGTQRDSILDWWTNGQMEARAMAIETGLKNGTYL